MIDKLPRLVLNYHVIFNDDEEAPWPAAERMLKATRSACKQSRNPAWHDRIRAFAAELGAGLKHLALPVDRGEALRISLEPLQFTSPWIYYEERRGAIDETTEVELV